jgi:hypothetical protein
VHGLDPGGKIQKLPEPKRRSAREIYPDAKAKARANSERKFCFLARRFRQSRQNDGSDLTAGWPLDRSLRERLPLTALEQAIMNREPPPGVVHHSDRGVQYASRDYVRMLRDHGMMASMSRPGNPYDNATQRMHNTTWAQWVDSTEVVAVSTDAQRSSSQQGGNLFLKGQCEE